MESLTHPWYSLWGGPCCGRIVELTEKEPYLPVSFLDRKDDVLLWRVGKFLGDWEGELAGHYYLADTGRAEFMPLPDSVRGLYTKYSQADGEDQDDGC
jgi:hypothetical protein